MSTSLEREQAFVREFPPVRTFEVGVASYLRRQKTAEEIRDLFARNGLPQYYDPVETPQEIREQMWNDFVIPTDQPFVFEPGKLILAHTSESVSIPDNESWRMKTYFVDNSRMLPLTTNLTASFLAPGSQGPQTYEVVNESREPISILLSDLKCLIEIRTMNSSPWRKTNTFSVQEVGKISLGKPTRW